MSEEWTYLQRLRSSSLQQIVNSHINNHSLPRAMYAKSADFDTMRASYIFDQWALTDDFDQRLSVVSFLVQIPYIS